MTAKPAARSNCPLCWKKKRVCIRDPRTGVCRDCKSKLGRVEHQDVIDLEARQSKLVNSAHSEIYKLVLAQCNVPCASQRDILPSMDIEGGVHDSMTLTIDMGDSSKNGPYVIHWSAIDGEEKTRFFNSKNPYLTTQIDNMVQDACAIGMYAVDPHSDVARKSVLAGGYAHLLCSTISSIESITTKLDGVEARYEYPQYNLFVHLRFFLFCRLEELVSETLEDIRHHDREDSSAPTSDTYLAAVILWDRLLHFKDKTISGELSELGHLSTRFRQMLLDWFQLVTSELLVYVRAGCGQNCSWQNAIGGSLRSCRRDDQTIKLVLTLEQVKYTLPTRTQQHLRMGIDDKYMLPHPSLEVEGLSSNISMGDEPQPFHVTGPLSDKDTREETSGLTLCNYVFEYPAIDRSSC